MPLERHDLFDRAALRSDTFSAVHRVSLPVSRAFAKEVGSFRSKDLNAGNPGINWCEMSEVSFGALPLIHSHISAMTYGRLLVPELLPASIEKYLYLDSDILVVDSVAKLWDRVWGLALLAARDRIGTVNGQGGLVNYRELGIPVTRNTLTLGSC